MKETMTEPATAAPGRAQASDMPTASWIDRALPAGLRPYGRLARLDRPIGFWLLLFPCWWGVALAAPGAPDLRLMGLFAVGALVMRGAGCTANDLADRDFDGRVARTALRPLASGAISPTGAIVFLVLQLIVGLVVLVQFNLSTILVGTLSLPIVFAYPFAKRVTHWPQIVLGFAFSWGALVGWTAVRGDLAAPAFVLYAACILWTVGYDTIYAHQDKDDDARLGLKSSALRLGARTRPWLFVFYGATIVVLSVVGFLAGIGTLFYVGLAAAAIQLGWQAARVNTDDPRDCLAKFKSNQWLGWIVLAAIVAGRVID